MNGLLLDTHVWFWHLIGSERLPDRLREALDNRPGDCWLSPISIWEIGMLAQKGRIQLGSELRTWISEAFKVFPLHIADLNLEVALSSLEVKLPHRDPADRFLAATAKVFDLTLVTVDRRLIAAPSLSTLVD